MSNVAYSDLIALPTLKTRVVGTMLEHYEETTSTNNHALASPVDGAVFVAETQQLGRGRQGKRWHSAPGLGLWFSIALAGPLPGISFAAALAIRDAVADTVSLRVKWPNDLYHDHRKLCGILVEQRPPRIALGIGLNVNHGPADFSPVLRYRSGSLALATGKHWDRTVLFQRLLQHLDDAILRLRHGDADEIRKEWINACDIIGRQVRRGALSGNVVAVDNEGALLVQTRHGMRRITCGDVSVLGYYM